jgi:hypothetical protein
MKDGEGDRVPTCRGVSEQRQAVATKGGLALNVRRWANLLRTTGGGLIGLLLLMLLPATAVPGAPLHGLVGGIFTDLLLLQISLACAAAYGAAWSLVFVQSILALDIRARVSGTPQPYPLDPKPSSDLLPPLLARFFLIPLNTWQMLVVYAAVIPTALCTVWFGRDAGTEVLAMDESGWTLAARVGAAVLGVFLGATFKSAIVAPVLLTVKSPHWSPPDRFLTRRIHALLRSRPKHMGYAERFMHCLRRVLSGGLTQRLFPAVMVPVEIGGETRQLLHPHHFLAAVASFAITLLLAISALVFAPPHVALGVALPPVFLVWVFCIELTWILGFFAFHLGRIGFSPALGVAAVLLAASFLDVADHDFEVHPRAAWGDPLDPVEAAATAPGDNLVVVCTAGGGIHAAAWSTSALEHLTSQRPLLADEIRLASGVSGGSVGTAFLLARAVMVEGKLTADDRLQVVRQSMQSSLAAVTYGLVYADLPRLFLLGLSDVWQPRDRGSFLERHWATTAEASSPKLDELVPLIRSGRIPAPIFNTTAMESGRRVMITPLVFEEEPTGRRAQTLAEYLDGQSGRSTLDLWTAARLSATFPWVTPAAHSDQEGDTHPRTSRHHFLDGGYYDNYGVASALEFLEVVLEERLRQLEDRASSDSPSLGFKRVALVQIRGSRPKMPTEKDGQESTLAELFGPLFGITAIRDGSAVTRNEIEVRRFVRAWNERFSTEPSASPDESPDPKKNQPRVEVRTFVLQPDQDTGEAPLSWHLTAIQKQRVIAAWENPTGALGSEIADLLGFLEGD